VYVILGLPAELPKFKCEGNLGEVPARTSRDPGGDVDNDQRDRSASLSAAAESVTSAFHSADDSSVLDTDMDEI